MRLSFVIRRRVVGCLVAAGLAGCSGSSTPAPATHSSLPSAAAANRNAAEHEAARLMSLVRVPPRTHTIAVAPPHLDGPGMGTPAGVTSLVDRARYWSVPMTFSEAVAWFESHPPRGHLKQSGSNSGGGPGYQVGGRSYSGGRSPAWQSAELSIAVASGDSGYSYVRADALVVWLDPHPIRDTAAGPRIHFTVVDGCPAADPGAPDVSNDAGGLDAALLPDERPTRALLCRYSGGNGRRFHLVGRLRLGGRAARTAADRIRRIPLAHVAGGVTSCPADDGSAGYAAFDYPAGITVDLKFALTGCATVTNGVILANRGLPKLFDQIAGPRPSSPSGSG